MCWDGDMGTAATNPSAPAPAASDAVVGAPASRPVRPVRPRRHAPATSSRPALTRPRACLATGVSAGVARHLGAPVWAVRALFVVLALCTGAGILLYLWCWALMPWETGDATPSRTAPVAWIFIGVAVAAAAASLAGLSGDVAGAIGARVSLASVVAVVAAATAGLWAGFVDRSDPARGPRQALWPQITAIAILVVMLVDSAAQAGSVLDRIVAILVPTFAIVLVLSPALIQRWRELSGERVKRIREEQRAEMAAHLHDSVLQTLALIQNRAGASSEAARLARAQERELRAWLYDGDQPADSDLPTDLRDYAGALELDYPARIDVVSAGLSTERASGELAAAAREAMLNAARHAGGEVSVYIEGGAAGVDVYVRDRGAGFDVGAVPADRLGIRQSVLGRMRRAGGTATIRSTDAGTEVHLHFGTHAEGSERG